MAIIASRKGFIINCSDVRDSFANAFPASAALNGTCMDGGTYTRSACRLSGTWSSDLVSAPARDTLSPYCRRICVRCCSSYYTSRVVPGEDPMALHGPERRAEAKADHISR